MKIQANEIIIRRFMASIQNNRLGHAYFFRGPARLGKTSTAYVVAKLVNCERVFSEGPCGQCESCRKIEKGIHPDVHFLKEEEEGGVIKIEVVRDLIRALQLKAYEGRKKVCIIRNVDHLTADAANALLKTLEEPTADSLLILTTAQADRVIATVKSRCQAMNFFPWASERLTQTLIGEDNLPEAIAHFLALYSEGNIGLARQLLKDKFYQRKNDVIDQFILSRDSEGFLKKILSEKSRTQEALDVLASVLRDLILLKAGVGSFRFLHRDRLADLEKTACRFSFADLERCFQEVVKTEQMLADNFNIKIAMSIIKETLWLE